VLGVRQGVELEEKVHRHLISSGHGKERVPPLDGVGGGPGSGEVLGISGGRDDLRSGRKIGARGAPGHQEDLPHGEAGDVFQPIDPGQGRDGGMISPGHSKKCLPLLDDVAFKGIRR